MELKQYLKVVKKHIGLVIFLTLLIGIASFLLSYFRPVTYDASISFAVNRINREETQDYQYDGYYAIQASDLVSQTVVSWFSTPSVVLEIYKEAGVEPESDSLEKFATLFNTKKYSAQNLGVKFTEKDWETAQKVSQATIDIIGRKVKELNKTSEAESLFEVVASPPVIVEKKASLILNTAIGLIIGFIIGLTLVYIINYFKGEGEENV